MQNRLSGNISANTLQLITNQLFALLIFLALSRGLDKNIFGQVSWSLALLLTLFALLGFGLDQLVVRKIAAGGDKQALFNAYLFHVIISGSLFYSLLLLQYFLLPGLFPQQFFLVCLGIGKLFLFFSMPFKQLAVGVEKFSLLMYMSVVSNIARGTALWILCMFDTMTITNIVLVFIAGDLAELVLCILLSRPVLYSRVKVRFQPGLYWMLIKQSLPQAGVVFFTAIMARFDWIILGIMASSVKLAEYSFAWKLFEVSTLPLLIMAPLMLPLFTRMLKHEGRISGISFLLEWQVIIACFVALILNMAWAPMVDFITGNKYGLVNVNTIFILSLAMPLLYFNNYLWTINFSAGKLKLVFFIIATSFVVNIAGCLFLIPIYQSEGAAISFFLTVGTQSLLYFFNTPGLFALNKLLNLAAWPILALFSGFIARELLTHPLLSLAASLLFFLVIIFVSKQVRYKDFRLLQAAYQ